MSFRVLSQGKGRVMRTFASPILYSTVVALLTSMCMPISWADDERPPAPKLPQRLSPLDGLIDPTTGEVFETFEPRDRQTADEFRQSDALAHYMSGRVALEKRDFPAAIVELKKSVDLNPAAMDTYQSLIPLLLADGQIEEAQNYALQAARVMKSGFGIVIGMASQFANRNQVDLGVELLDRARIQGNYKRGTREHLLLHRDLGLFYRLSGKIEEAAKYYEIVLKVIQDDLVDEETRSEVLKDAAKNFDEFGDTFLKAGKPELALEAFDEASKYRDAAPALHSFNLATVFQQTGKPKLALESLQEYFDAQLQGRGQAAYQLLAKILEDLGKQDELIARLEKLFESDEFNDPLRFFLADQWLKKGNLPRAKQLYLGTQEEVTDPRAMVGMLQIRRKDGDYDKLLTLLTKAFRTIPRPEDPEDLQNLGDDLRQLAEAFDAELELLKEDNDAMTGIFAEGRERVSGDDPQASFVVAYLLGKLATEGDYTEPAIEFYRLAIGMRNDPPFQLYSELAGYLIDSKHYQTAIDVLNEAITNPSNSLQSERWRALYFLSYAYEFEGETDKAIESVDAARNAGPGGAQGRLLFQKGWVYSHAKQWESAIDYYQQVLSGYPTDTKLVQDTKFNLSAIYVEQGDLENGERELLEVMKKDPENTRANNDLGYLWADQGKNLPKAKEMIQKALDEEPENPAYLDSYGWVLYRLGEFQEAADYLKKATEQKNGDDSTIFDHLGDALLKLGKTEEANEVFRKALELEEEKDHPSEKLLNSIREKLDLDESSLTEE